MSVKMEIAMKLKMLKSVAILGLGYLALTPALAQSTSKTQPETEQTLKDFPKEPKTTRPDSSGVTNFINNSGGDRSYEFDSATGPCTTTKISPSTQEQETPMPARPVTLGCVTVAGFTCIMAMKPGAPANTLRADRADIEYTDRHRAFGMPGPPLLS
jgi:hypothetical protein